MSTEPASTDPAGTGSAATARARRTPFWLELALAIAFGLFFAYDAWEAVGNLVGIAGVASALGTTLSATGWIVLILAILLPVALFAIAFLLGRRRSAPVQAALYLAGLAVSALLYLDILLLFGPGALLA
ncbi:bacitracin resistance protein [Agromyces binzhouensis]|uniref:Bacitracin resistance protein n=1 Tax=Agromyces binzhouensis TaxID=1817495 RepID=A0A4Q2JUB2_9MICO|nr:bacitracin resistance protein [Agromyces binzhouensis]RXZ49728.1 bacitracin resistance protein [Agromyces binzhouensis]